MRLNLLFFELYYRILLASNFQMNDDRYRVCSRLGLFGVKQAIKELLMRSLLALTVQASQPGWL